MKELLTKALDFLGGIFALGVAGVFLLAPIIILIAAVKIVF